MSFKDILVHVDSTPEASVRLRLGLTLAGRFGAHLCGLHVIPKPDLSSRCIGTREKFHHYIRDLLMAPRGQGTQHVYLDPYVDGPSSQGVFAVL
jgi:nucleotide-binding universal stress UspA family protein